MFQALFEGWDFNRATAVVRSRQLGKLVKHSQAVFGEAVWNNEATCAGVRVVVEEGGLRCWLMCWSRRWVGVAGGWSVIVGYKGIGCNGNAVAQDSKCCEDGAVVGDPVLLPWHGT